MRLSSQGPLFASPAPVLAAHSPLVSLTTGNDPPPPNGPQLHLQQAVQAGGGRGEAQAPAPPPAPLGAAHPRAAEGRADPGPVPGAGVLLDRRPALPRAPGVAGGWGGGEWTQGRRCPGVQRGEVLGVRAALGNPSRGVNCSGGAHPCAPPREPWPLGLSWGGAVGTPTQGHRSGRRSLWTPAGPLSVASDLSLTPPLCSGRGPTTLLGRQCPRGSQAQRVWCLASELEPVL